MNLMMVFKDAKPIDVDKSQTHTFPANQEPEDIHDWMVSEVLSAGEYVAYTYDLQGGTDTLLTVAKKKTNGYDFVASNDDIAGGCDPESYPVACASRVKFTASGNDQYYFAVRQLHVADPLTECPKYGLILQRILPNDPTPTPVPSPTPLPTPTPLPDSHEPNNTQNTATLIDDNNRIDAAISPKGDVDVYKMRLKSGENDVFLEFKIPNEKQWLQISFYSEQGYQIIKDEVLSGNSIRQFKVLQPGLYYFTVKAYDPFVGITETYYSIKTDGLSFVALQKIMLPYIQK